MNKNISTSTVEFITLMALLSALGAMATDTMLPALSQMRSDLGVKNPNEIQLIVSFIFFGFAFGQIFYGPISDSIGRKSTMYIALSIFILGSFISMITDDFYIMLIGRFLQGFGASGPKILGLAIIRDIYKGRQMAKIMSFISMVFILVPTLAPAVGGFILQYGTWHYIFFMFIFIAFISLIWFAFRQEETLKIENRKALNIKTIKKDMIKVLKHKKTISYTLVLGIIFGVFISYLSTAEQIFTSQYLLGDKFPLYFAINALAFGFASVINAKLVVKYGMKYLSNIAAICFIIVCFIYIFISFTTDGNPSLLLFMIFCMISFFCIGMLFGNLNALAMEPMGDIAGTAAAVIGSVSTFLSLPIGIIIGQFYNGTITPMIISFSLASILSYLILRWVNKS